MISPHNELFTPITGDDGLPDFEVGLPTLSAWADVSDETILQHVKDGVVRRHGRGCYRLREALQARARFLADEKRHATKSAAESRVQDARAKEIELRIAVKQRELVPLDDMMDLVDRYAVATKAAIMNIPNRASRDPVERARLAPFIDEALTTIADAMQKAADEARTGQAATTSPTPAPNRAARRRAARGGPR